MGLFQRARRRQSAGARGTGRTFRVLSNEPRIVTVEAVEKLREAGASKELIDIAERAVKRSSTTAA